MPIIPYRKKWKGTMTDRVRFSNQMHYKPVDRSFNMEFGYWDENFTQWPLFTQNGISNNTDANTFFNFDTFLSIEGNVWLSPPFDSSVIGETETLKIMMNDDGLLAEVPKDGHGSIPHYLKPTIVTPDDWKRCKEVRFQRDDPKRKIDLKSKHCLTIWGSSTYDPSHLIDDETLEEFLRPDREFPLGIHCGSLIGKIRNMLTFEGLAYACCDYPDMVEDMVETCCVLIEDYLDQILPYFQFDFASGWEDICFKNGPIVSVDFFKSVVMPRYQRISKKLRSAGIDIWFTDAHIRPSFSICMAGTSE